MTYYKVVKNVNGKLYGILPLNDSIRVEYKTDGSITVPKVPNSEMFICTSMEEAETWYYNAFDNREIWEIEANDVSTKILVNCPSDEEVGKFWKNETKGILMQSNSNTICKSLKMIKKIK